MKISIITALGLNATIDFQRSVVCIVDKKIEAKLRSHRAILATKAHTEHKNWPKNGGYYINADELFIALDADQARIFDDAMDQYRQSRIKTKPTTARQFDNGYCHRCETYCFGDCTASNE